MRPINTQHLHDLHDLRDPDLPLRRFLRAMFSLKADGASHREIQDRLLSGGVITGTNLIVLICAMIIASVGLNTGSTAVIIGAMLISPLMGSILAMSYGTAANDFSVIRNHLIGFLLQIVFSVAASTIYFWLSPIKEPTSELLARTSPTFYDVLIAFFGGLAGIVGQTRSDKANNIIPGVAIATALMPPLCTCGYSIANSRWDMLAGAAYLFLINTYFIFLSGTLILGLLGIPKVHEMSDHDWRKLKFRMIRNAVIIALPSILVFFAMR